MGTPYFNVRSFSFYLRYSVLYLLNAVAVVIIANDRSFLNCGLAIDSFFNDMSALLHLEVVLKNFFCLVNDKFVCVIILSRIESSILYHE